MKAREEVARLRRGRHVWLAAWVDSGTARLDASTKHRQTVAGLAMTLLDRTAERIAVSAKGAPDEARRNLAEMAMHRMVVEVAHSVLRTRPEEVRMQTGPRYAPEAASLARMPIMAAVSAGNPADPDVLSVAGSTKGSSLMAMLELLLRAADAIAAGHMPALPAEGPVKELSLAIRPRVELAYRKMMDDAARHAVAALMGRLGAPAEPGAMREIIDRMKPKGKMN